MKTHFFTSSQKKKVYLRGIGYLLFMGLLLISCKVKGQIPAFPGAEGFGRFTTGGRGGEIIYVTNLNDSGPGSLRSAVEIEVPRIVVFALSGTITLESPLEIEHGDLTIAGQSAPGDGICIRNYPVEVSADNIIIRYMRFRLGDKTKLEDDAFKGIGNHNMIIDHCSISWGIDEVASFYDNTNFTMQWCIISESLNNSFHSKGEHGYGGIWGGRKATFHHNLIAHHNSRTPRFNGSRTMSGTETELTDFRNNVIYNWVINSVYGGEEGRYNMVKNYYKSGPATPSDKAGRIVNPSIPYGTFYVAGNYVEGYPEVSADNWAGGVQCENPPAARRAGPFDYAPVTEQEPLAAFEKVLRFAGASLHRDAVDKRVVREVQTGAASYAGSKTGLPGIIDSQEDVGGWPELQSLSTPEDTDRDGMPDRWERDHGLQPDDASDAAAFTLHEGYTNVEVYLNGLVDHITKKSS